MDGSHVPLRNWNYSVLQTGVRMEKVIKRYFVLPLFVSVLRAGSRISGTGVRFEQF